MRGVFCDLRFYLGVVCARYAARARIACIYGSLELGGRGKDCLLLRGGTISSQSTVAGYYAAYCIAKLVACNPCASSFVIARHRPDCPRLDTGWHGAAGSPAYTSACWHNF